MKKSLGKLADRAQNTIKRRIEKEIERAFHPDIEEITTVTDLEKLDIPELYKILEKKVTGSTSIARGVQESIQGQVAFLYEMARALSTVRDESLSFEEVLKIIKDCEESFLQKLKKAGLKVQYESEVSPEELKAKPALILATHQGGGWENYLVQALTGIESGIVVKGELMKLPYVGDGLRRKKAIAVQRGKLQDPETRRVEITRIAGEIVEHLADNKNMLVFFEGTRSSDGQIAATQKRKAWTKDLLAAVDLAWHNKKMGDEKMADKEYQKLLLVVHTMTTMPDAPEEDFVLSRFRLGTTLAAKLIKADGLKVEDTEDHYDAETLFGKARTILKKMLIHIVVEHQENAVKDAPVMQA